MEDKIWDGHKMNTYTGRGIHELGRLLRSYITKKRKDRGDALQGGFSSWFMSIGCAVSYDNTFLTINPGFMDDTNSTLFNSIASFERSEVIGIAEKIELIDRTYTSPQQQVMGISTLTKKIHAYCNMIGYDTMNPRLWTWYITKQEGNSTTLYVDLDSVGRFNKAERYTKFIEIMGR